MEDRNQEILRNYRLKVHNIYRARGAFLLETDCGIKLFKSYDGTRNKAMFEHTVKEHLFDHGYYNSDLFVKTIDDDIIVEDSNGCKYIMKNWFWGEECNLKELSQIEIGAANLGNLHNILTNVNLTKNQIEYNTADNLFNLFEKRNRELKRVRGYIRNKRQKNEFEISFINYYNEFYNQGLAALKRLCCSSYSRLMSEAISKKSICHGNYTYHNIIIVKTKAEAFNKNYVPPGWINKEPLSVTDLSRCKEAVVATTNFEKAEIGLQITDLYQFIRKVMEKNDWDVLYGSNIIEAYDKLRPISKEELNILYILLLYPEKFWKITNFYFNGKKSWVSARNISKLNSIGEQNPKKIAFLQKLESIL
mgnify:CR=1 FL=1